MEKVLPRTRVRWKVHRIERKRAKDTQASHNDTENDSKETEINTLEQTITFHSENPCEHCENAKVYENIDHGMY